MRYWTWAWHIVWAGGLLLLFVAMGAVSFGPQPIEATATAALVIPEQSAVERIPAAPVMEYHIIEREDPESRVKRLMSVLDERLPR